MPMPMVRRFGISVSRSHAKGKSVLNLNSKVKHVALRFGQRPAALRAAWSDADWSTLRMSADRGMVAARRSR